MRIRSADATDERIVGLLVRNARLTYREIGAEVGLSANAVAQRMRRLEADGTIRGYTIELDPDLHDTTRMEAVVHLRTTIDSDPSAIEAGLGDLPAVVEVLDLAGTVDYEVRLRCASQDELHAAVQQVRSVPGVAGVETRPVLRRVLRRDR